MPTLAKQIVDSNAQGTNFVLNFKGFAVGNPYTDPYSGTPAMIGKPATSAFSQKARLELHALTLTDTYWGHQLVAKPTWDSYQAKCVNAVKKNVRDCLSLEMTILNGVGNLNPYALDYPVCTADSATKAGYSQRLWLLNSRFSSVMSREEIRQKVRTRNIEKLFLFIDKNIYVFGNSIICTRFCYHTFTQFDSIMNRKGRMTDCYC